MWKRAVLYGALALLGLGVFIGARVIGVQTEYANLLYRLSMTFTEILPIGVLVSLASAALLRNSRFLPMRHS
jgi:hypothetical protein